jgi:hypothetical protein
MAYMNQEKKAIIAKALKAVVPKDWKYSLSVDNHSTIVMTIKSAPVDLIEEVVRVNNNRNCADYQKFQNKPESVGVNPYWLDTQFDKNLAVFQAIKDAMYSAGWYDNSDIQTDYFNTAYYIDINLGRWNKPFQVVS